MRGRRIAMLAAGAALALLTGCTGLAAPPVGSTPTPDPQFAARQLAAVGLTVDDFGVGWQLVPGEDGTGGGPLTEQAEGAPCEWTTEWLPGIEPFSTSSWRMYTAGDDLTFASDWIIAAASGVDLRDVLEEFRSTISACEPFAYDDGGTVALTPMPPLDLGDDAFSYLATFTGPDGEPWGLGEVHTIVCGPLWIHLSYVGLDPFVERDALLATLFERVSPLGGC